ncbi:MAG: hypothetical protein AAF361_11185 [Bacteroidota bacterium]
MTALLLIFALVLPTWASSQESKDESAQLNWFDQIIGLENLSLHHGVVYQEAHRVKSKKSKFFPTSDFSKGSVNFNGQDYYDLDLKYNVYEDLLLMRIENRLGGNILRLYEHKISGFVIGNHHFVNLRSEEVGEDIVPGFYEVALDQPGFSLLKKHQKLLTRQLESTIFFYEFEELDKSCVLYYGEKYHPIDKISDLTKLFPDQRDALEAQYKSLRSEATFDLILESLLIQLKGHSQENKPQK